MENTDSWTKKSASQKGAKHKFKKKNWAQNRVENKNERKRQRIERLDKIDKGEVVEGL